MASRARLVVLIPSGLVYDLEDEYRGTECIF